MIVLECAPKSVFLHLLFPRTNLGKTSGLGLEIASITPNDCSGRLRVGFTDNLSFGNQPIVKVVTVFTATLFIY